MDSRLKHAGMTTRNSQLATRIYFQEKYAGVVKLADAPVSGTGGLCGCGGSSPPSGTGRHLTNLLVGCTFQSPSPLFQRIFGNLSHPRNRRLNMLIGIERSH